MNYLEKAAAQIESTIKDAERSWSPGGETMTSIRMDCARAYAALAAIDKGLLPQPVAEEIYKGFGGAS